LASTWIHNFTTGGPRVKEFLLTKSSSKILRYRITDHVTSPAIKSWLMIKNSWADADGSALVSKEITQTPSADGVITISTTSYVEFVIDNDDLDSVDEGAYCISVKTLFEDGETITHDGATTRIHVISAGVVAG
jgi:hypothetical protein